MYCGKFSGEVTIIYSLQYIRNIKESKNILAELSKKQNVILDVFGSPYAFKDVDISTISTVFNKWLNPSSE